MLYLYFSIAITVLIAQFVHGARLSDSRQTLRYNADGATVFVSASLGVVFDRASLTQSFYRGHRNSAALISLDVDASGTIAASGEMADNPEIHVWDCRACRFVTKFTNVHCVGVTCLAFSPSGEYLVSLGQDALHSAAVFSSPSRKWNDGTLLCSVSVSPQKMLWCSYLEGNAFPICIGGVAGHNKGNLTAATEGGVYFFRVVRGHAERRRGVFGRKHKIQTVLAAVPATQPGPPKAMIAGIGTGDSQQQTSSGDVSTKTIPATAVGSERALICGTVSGYLYLFFNGRVVVKTAAHESSVLALAAMGQFLLTAGKDGKVKLWRDDLQVMHVFKVAGFSPRPQSVCVHSVCFSAGPQNGSGSAGGNGTALIGMRSGEVYEVSLQNHSACQLLLCHSELELHGAVFNPQNPDTFATAGDDGTLRLWSVSSRCCLRTVSLDCAMRALCWSNDGTKLVVGVGGVAAIASKDGE